MDISEDPDTTVSYYWDISDKPEQEQGLRYYSKDIVWICFITSSGQFPDTIDSAVIFMYSGY